MTKRKTPPCGEEQALEDKRVLVCVMPADHSGPTHEDANGERWGDPMLPTPAHHLEPADA